MEPSQNSISTSSPSDRAVLAGIQIFRILGGLLVLFYFIEAFASLWSLELRNPSSELRFTSSMVDRIPLGVLGLGLLFLHPRFIRRKVERFVLGGLAWVPLLLAGIQLLLIPMSMNSAARLFQISSYNLNLEVEDQAKKVRSVLDTTLRLSEMEQQNMVNRYNAANPNKKPVELSAFIQNLKDEVQLQEKKINEQRQAVMGQQKKILYGSQFGYLLRSGVGVAALFFLWRAIGWARQGGQKSLGLSLATSGRR